MTQPFDNRDWDQRRLAEKDAEIERLKALLLRAADALDYQLKFINEHCCDGYPSCGDLIAELRKAAR